MMKVLLIGKEGRLDCIADALLRSARPPKLYTISELKNPGLIEKSVEVKIGRTDDLSFVEAYAKRIRPDFAIIGPEEPLAAGVVDILTDKLGIPCVGPRKTLARLESSKSFTRELLSKYHIPGNPEFMVFRAMEGIHSYLMGRANFVVKPDGLTGGKGVKIFGKHLSSIEEALEYCRQLFEVGHEAVVIEEELDGEEFILQSFCDGVHVVDTVAVQDHKRAFDGDEGPNTGGMGSYSCADHSLPFLSQEFLKEASVINAAVAKALFREVGEEYKGILYGSFMVTAKGIKVIEYNARFGDPEALNVLPILKTDFLDVCEAIIAGSLDRLEIEFESKATVCKYIVPEGYPDHPQKGTPILIDSVPMSSDSLRTYFAAVEKEKDAYYLTGSRAIAFVGIGDTLEEAEQIAERAASRVGGEVFHRKDIGTWKLIQRRMEHVKKLADMNEKVYR